MDRLPVLEVDGATIGHSAAIERYLASLLGLNGATLVDSALIDGICNNIGEMVGAFRRIVPFARDLGARRASALSQWYETPPAWERKRGGEEQGRVLRDGRMLPFFLQKLEKCVGADGSAVGGRASLADVKLYLTLVDQPAHGAGFADKADGSRHAPPAGVIRNNAAEAKAAIDRCLEATPRIARIVRSFAALPNVRRY